jgi:hypothetical protein
MTKNAGLNRQVNFIQKIIGKNANKLNLLMNGEKMIHGHKDNGYTFDHNQGTAMFIIIAYLNSLVKEETFNPSSNLFITLPCHSKNYKETLENALKLINKNQYFNDFKKELIKVDNEICIKSYYEHKGYIVMLKETDRFFENGIITEDSFQKMKQAISKDIFVQLTSNVVYNMSSDFTLKVTKYNNKNGNPKNKALENFKLANLFKLNKKNFKFDKINNISTLLKNAANTKSFSKPKGDISKVPDVINQINQSQPTKTLSGLINSNNCEKR